MSAAALASVGGLTLGGLVNTVEAAAVPPSVGFPGIGFEGVPANTRALNVSLGGAATAVVDKVTVPAGYTAQVFVSWGDAIMPGGTAFRGDAAETAAQQAKQFGMHNDGMHFFPFPGASGAAASDRGLLCVNNEYTHEEILFTDGQLANYGIAKTRKSQAAHGVSIVEARRVNGKWSVVKNSIYGRRITANTKARVSGPAAGHALMKSREFAITDSGSVATGALLDGFTAYGTINNCAHGITPWGTYLTCEENWNGNFGGTGAVDTSASTEVGKLNRRYGVSASGAGYRWHTHRRALLTSPPTRTSRTCSAGVVEIDPYAPASLPVKRTALGRFKHESAQYVVDADNNVAIYMGDDERNEYIYKFVCAGKFNPTNRAANRDLLDSGTLYVARFNNNLSGEWIALQPGTIGVDGKPPA